MLKKLTTLSAYSLSSFLLFLPIACQEEKSDYVIGLAVSLTGPDKASGQSMLHAVEMKADEINKRGGIKGHQVKVKVLDDRGDLQASKANLVELQKDPSILAVIGYPHRTVLNDTPQIVVFNRASAERSVGDDPTHPWVFGLSYSDEQRQRVLAAYIRSFEPSPKVLIVNADSAEAAQGVDLFESLANKAGLSVRRLNLKSASEVALGPDDSESIVLFAPNPMDFIRAIHRSHPGTSIYGDQRVTNAIEKNLKDPLVANVFGCSPYTFAMARFESIEFKERYAKLYGSSPTIGGAFAYDATSLLIEAFRAKDTPTRQSVRESLAKRNSTLSAYPGTTARLYFDNRQHVNRPVILQHVFDGSLRPAFRQLRKVLTDAPRDREHKFVEVDGEVYYEQNVVYIGADFLGLDSIDSQKKEIDISALVWMKWQGDFSPESLTLLNEAAAVDKIKLKHGPFSEEVHSLPFRNIPNSKDKPEIMFAAYKFKLPLRFEFQLSMFPFDTQSIPITLTNPSVDNNKLAFVADTEYIGDKKLEDPNWTQIRRKDHAAYFTQHSSQGTYKNAERSAHQRTYVANYEIRVDLKRSVFGYIFSIFVPIFACLLLCFLAFYIKLEDTSSRLAMITGSFFVAVLSHIGLRGSVGVSYLVSADVFYFISYGSIIAAILAVNIIEDARQKDATKARKVQLALRRALIYTTFIAFALYSAKLLFLA